MVIRINGVKIFISESSLNDEVAMVVSNTTMG